MDNMKNFIGVREYARRHNISFQTVYKKISRGKLVLNRDYIIVTKHTKKLLVNDLMEIK